MSLQDFTKEELEEKFEMFLFYMDDNLEEFIERLDKKGYKLDYSLDSLDSLEKYIHDEKILLDDDDVNNSAMYFGECIRKAYGGTWRCSLGDKDSINYGLPVLHAFTEPKDLELSPIEDVETMIVRPRNNHFKTVIKGYINPDEIDWSDFPDEEESKPDKTKGDWSVFD